MDKIKSAQQGADEVKAIMLENLKKAEERRENISALNQRAELKNTCGDLEKAVNPKKKRIMDYLQANKGLLIVVLFSAIIIFAVVVAMLATQDMHVHEHPELHSDLEKP